MSVLGDFHAEKSMCMSTFGLLLADNHCFYQDTNWVSELQSACRLVILGVEGKHDSTIFVVAWRAAAVGVVNSLIDSLLSDTSMILTISMKEYAAKPGIVSGFW